MDIVLGPSQYSHQSSTQSSFKAIFHEKHATATSQRLENEVKIE